MNPAETVATPPPTQRNILTVQGCSGCGRPRKQRIKTPFGTRVIVNRLKLTRVPASIAIATETLHPRRAPVTRTYSVLAPFCKTCRAQAQGADRPNSYDGLLPADRSAAA
jgi:hypothetical protein